MLLGSDPGCDLVDEVYLNEQLLIPFWGEGTMKYLANERGHPGEDKIY